MCASPKVPLLLQTLQVKSCNIPMHVPVCACDGLQRLSCQGGNAQVCVRDEIALEFINCCSIAMPWETCLGIPGLFWRLLTVVCLHSSSSFRSGGTTTQCFLGGTLTWKWLFTFAPCIASVPLAWGNLPPVWKQESCFDQATQPFHFQTLHLRGSCVSIGTYFYPVTCIYLELQLAYNHKLEVSTDGRTNIWMGQVKMAWAFLWCIII